MAARGERAAAKTSATIASAFTSRAICCLIGGSPIPNVGSRIARCPLGQQAGPLLRVILWTVLDLLVEPNHHQRKSTQQEKEARAVMQSHFRTGIRVGGPAQRVHLLSGVLVAGPSRE